MVREHDNEDFESLKQRAIRIFEQWVNQYFSRLPRYNYSRGFTVTADSVQAPADIPQFSEPSKTMGQPGHFPESDVAEEVRYTD